MLGEIGAELQAICTDENRVRQQKCLYGKNGTDGPLPDCITTGRLGIDWWQERLALIVGREIIHAHRYKWRQYGEEYVPISGLEPCTKMVQMLLDQAGVGC